MKQIYKLDVELLVVCSIHTVFYKDFFDKFSYLCKILGY